MKAGKFNVADRAGQKLTPQREAVFQVILEREDHPTASDIFEAARQRLPTISYATVYNSLRYLKEDMVSKVALMRWKQIHRKFEVRGELS